MNCPTCGQAVLTGTRYCGNCGSELTNEEDPPSVPDIRTVVETQPMPYLLITAGSGRGQTFELRGEASLGRSRSNAIVLSDSKVSRNHARLDPVRSTYILTDLGSANGTFVNGVRITQPVRLRDGDSLQVGDTQLVFHTRPPTHSPQAAHVEEYSPPSPFPVVDPGSASDASPLSVDQRVKLPTWAWVGCAVLIIIILLLMVLTLTTGILIGQGLGGT
jgi:pSer/pThr/pTyr-binding forkhead associated (FHA) protein